MSRRCSHLDQVTGIPSAGRGCEECLAMGDTWVHLRACRTCGHVGCCDSSKNRHATKHFRATGHPIVTSVEPGETWSYCYVDDVMFELDPRRAHP
ncbi:UBP-type zinc finger domain-containing protein [Sandaracinus amylolyticus]|uniref:UBP-type zinc finger domain-containing protein n=1 Tax=Sandaracinus amylolyticus TaxID=927083 RepID=UPI001F48A147|nr:UBP-type zinc finger domain-containing protein [Sandaracinus amylolyticus]UJR78458.1 Putative Glutathione-regulated potassium-efflux system protein KefB [Sandaracinus amylolyticus]